MCLQKKKTLEQIKKFISEIPVKKGIKVYKVVGVEKKEYFPPVANTKISYKTGSNDAIQVPLGTYDNRNEEYDAGFHFFVSRDAAETYLNYMENIVVIGYEGAALAAKDRGEIFYKKYQVIECIVKKSWITMIGVQPAKSGFDAPERTVVVAKKAIFPAFSKK